MFKVRAGLFIFAAVLFSCGVQANYQAEHYVEFDETMRYQFMPQQDDIDQLPEGLYPSVLPYQPLLQGMLQGIMPYQLLAISADDESPYFLIKSTGSYVYLVGYPDEYQLDVILQKLSNYKNIVLICDEWLQSYFVQHGFVFQPRIEFEYDYYHDLVQKEVPAGFTVQPLDIKLLRQSPWYGFIASVHAGAQNFLDKAFGFALVNEEGVSVAQAYGAFIGGGECEIGVITHPDHRGKGYVIYPAIATIQESLARGLTPAWSCNSENIASYKTAHKLGFTIKRHYVFLKKF